MKKIIFLTVLFVSLSLSVSVFAKRLLPRAGGTKATGIVSSSRGVTASVKFRADRLAAIVSFSNLNIVSKVDYFLSYGTRGTTQGASGSIVPPAAEPIVRELLFGTCSKGVCRYDYGITNAKLVVTTYSKSGKKVIKTFRLKV